MMQILSHQTFSLIKKLPYFRKIHLLNFNLIERLIGVEGALLVVVVHDW